MWHCSMALLELAASAGNRAAALRAECDHGAWLAGLLACCADPCAAPSLILERQALASYVLCPVSCPAGVH